MNLIYDEDYHYKFYFWYTSQHGSHVTTGSLNLRKGDDIGTALKRYMTSSNAAEYAARSTAVVIMKQKKDGDATVTSETFQINRDFAGPNEKK